MRRFTHWLLGVSFLGLTSLVAPGVVLGQAAGDPFGGPAPATEDPFGAATNVRRQAAPQPVEIAERTLLDMAHASIERTLDDPTDINVVELEFGQLMHDLAKRHEIPIVLDPEGLERAGITTDQLVTMKLESVSLRSALRTLLRPMQMTAIVRDEALQITSLDTDERSAFVRTYSLAPLAPTATYEVVAALEMVWPENEENADEKFAKPRAMIAAGSLVVRGSPRHHELTEDLLRGLARNARRSAPQPNPAVGGDLPPAVSLPAPTGVIPAPLPALPDSVPR